MSAAEHPNLHWHATKRADSEELIHNVAARRLDYTIANSDIIAINQRYYPKLNTAFGVGPPRKLAWAFQRGADSSLYNKAIEFILKIKKNGELASLNDRYFGHLHRLNYVGSTTFARDAKRRLPRYEKAFKRAAKTAKLDWRVLAAQSYQESNWRANAVSPTGVRGLMMLTQATASDLDIDNRIDPISSIKGGARYLREMLDRLPASIHKPDRVWMALATYDIGLGHLMDARRITEKQGGNPDRWVDVRKRLLLLTQREWYKKTRNGYARGYEAVNYVANIRSYYDILLWMTKKKREGQSPAPKNAPNPSTRERQKTNRALKIESPAL
jgi:membrane-bound lytic murein transglycosylase F